MTARNATEQTSPQPETAARETIAILDFGSQYTQLIARRIRELEVYSEIFRFDVPAAELAAKAPAGVILSGGPASVYDEGAPQLDPAILDLPVPVLGICYGQQAMIQALGGRVERGDRREYGHADVRVAGEAGEFFADLPADTPVWMSHGDLVTQVPDGFQVIGATANSPAAAVADPRRHRYGIQFHPEVEHTRDGTRMLQNFLFKICRCARTWSMTRFVEETVASLQEQHPAGSVVLGISGGVDSTVAAVLLKQAFGDRVHPIFVDNGLLRKNERRSVERFLGEAGIAIHTVDATDRFLEGLAGVEDPEAKRKIIGRTFIEVFEREAKTVPDVRFLAQGTLYPDRIESSPTLGPSVTIKTHHNVGGLPERMRLTLIEPLRDLFKDEVRRLGELLGLPRERVWRHPFPGPGLAVRIIGPIAREDLDLLREADAIFTRELRASGWYDRSSQAFAVLLPVKTVG